MLPRWRGQSVRCTGEIAAEERLYTIVDTIWEGAGIGATELLVEDIRAFFRPLRRTNGPI